MEVLEFYITPLGLNARQRIEKTPLLLRCELWEIDIFMCPGDRKDLTLYLWVTAEQPVTHQMIDDWVCDHFGAVEITAYNKH